MERQMAEKLVSRFMCALGADVIGQNPAIEDVLVSAMVEKLKLRLLPAMRRRDADSFSEIVRKGVDEPGFDKAFDIVLEAACASGWAGQSECDMLRGVARNVAAEQIVEHTRGKDEYFVMFAVPVQGKAGTLAEAFESGRGGEVLAGALQRSGFIDKGAEVMFLPAAIDPADLAEAGPGALRYAAASIGVAMLSEDHDSRTWKSARTFARRVAGEREEKVWDDPENGSEIRFAIGGYYRKWRSDEMTADALLMSAGKYDDVPADLARQRDRHLAARRRDFMREVDEAADFRAGAPALAPRACSQLAYMNISASLLNNAGYQGLISEDATRIEPEDLVYYVSDGQVVVLAKFGDEVANSDPLPYSMVSNDIEHFRSLLTFIHPAARPMEDSADPEPIQKPRAARG
jgi:hypothetical protein